MQFLRKSPLVSGAIAIALTVYAFAGPADVWAGLAAGLWIAAFINDLSAWIVRRI